MRLFTPILAAALVLSLPSLANARGFDSDIPGTISGPIKIEVVVSEDLANRAENLPEKLSDRASRGRLNSPFSNNGKYGQREIDRLVDRLHDELDDDFEKYGIKSSDTAPTTLRVTLELAKPNRPTFYQLSEDPSLSFSSFGTGGAEMTAVLIGANGEDLGTMEYDYYSNLNDHPFFANSVGIWTDADRSIARFSKRASKKLAKQGAGGNT